MEEQGMKIDWGIVWTTLGAGGLGLGFIGWLVREIIKHYLNKDIDKAKIEIESKYELEAEKFKSGLRVAEKENEIRYAEIHGRRAEVLIKLGNYPLRWTEHRAKRSNDMISDSWFLRKQNSAR